MFNFRINRVNFFLGVMLHGVVIAGLGWFIVEIYRLMLEVNIMFVALLFALSFLGIIVEVSLFSLVVRRLHDINVSGVKSLFIFIPVINIFFALYIFLTPGVNENNSYGGDPSNDRFLDSILGRRLK